MNHDEQISRFGSVPRPDYSWQHPPKRENRPAYRLGLGALMGLMLGAALFGPAMFGG